MTSLYAFISSTLKHWYLPLVIGLLYMAVGIYVFTVPLETYFTLSVLFSISFIVSGLADIFFSIQNNKIISGWGWYLVSGLISVALGVYLVAYPGISITLLPFAVAFTLLFRSAYLLGLSFDLRSYGVASWGNLTASSILGIILSILLLSNPIITGLSLSVLTALTFILIGISAVVLSVNLKKMKDLPEKISLELKSKIEQLQKEVKAQAGK